MPELDDDDNEDDDFASREPSPKRRRVHVDVHHSPDSADELAAAPYKPSSPRPRPSNRRHSSSGERIQDSQEDIESPDELDHTFASYHAATTITKQHSSTTPLRPQDTADVTSSPPLAATPPPPPGGGNPPVNTDANTKPAPRLTYKPALILRGHKRGVCAVKISPDGQWIASCSADATIKIWDARTGAHHSTLSGHLSGVNSISWAPDSRTLASGSDDKTIRLWDTTTSLPAAAPLQGHANYVSAVAFSAGGNMLVSGAHDEAVTLWDVRRGRALRTLPAHSDPVGGVDFSRDGSLCASCASDGLIRVWDTATGQCLRTFFHEDTPAVASVRFSPNGRYILAAMLDSRLRLWNYVDGRCVKTFQGHVNERFGLMGAFGVYGGGGDEDVRAFVTVGSEDGAVLLWDVQGKEVLQRLQGHDGVVLGVDVHAASRTLVSCGLDRTVRVWREG